MKLQLFLIAAISLGLAACAKEEAPAPEPAPEPEQAVAPEPQAEASVPMAEVSEALIKHMHAHADKMDDINFALADGDLDAAMTPAYWLSRHESVEGMPEEWQPFMKGMREGAKAIEASTDLESARAAAKTITAQCQGCHQAAGIVE
ncbi:MAG: hypothetical protein QNJ07_02155 [Woeseiaceae bacterium]|nr:hypothetical protein [Woeseiaceae bacterium]